MSAQHPIKFKLPKNVSMGDLSAAGSKETARNRIVILALRKELERRMVDGFSLRQLHAQLVSDGFLTSHYSSFRRAARVLKLGVVPSHEAPPEPSKAIAAIAPPEAPSTEPVRSKEEIVADLSKRRSFVFNPSRDPKDFKS